MIDELITDLKSDEGFVPHAYQDHLGYWTIGYGFLIDKNKGGELPLDVAEHWLTYAVTKRWNALVQKLPWLLDQPESVQRALANMAYQLGVDGTLKFKHMLEALKEGNRELAADHALDSTWATQTPERAQRVAALIRG